MLLRAIIALSLVVTPGLLQGKREAPEWQDAIIRVAESERPSVVSIKLTPKESPETKKFFEFRWPGEGEPRLPEEFRRWFREFKKERPMRGYASGFVCEVKGDDVYILTNLHVIKDSRKIKVKFADGRTFQGEEVEVVGKDKPSDLALLKVKSKSPPPALSFAETDVRVGQWVVAVGNPFGLDETFTFGIVSAIGRSGVRLPYGPEYQEFIQTDASINPGNSGGPLVNLHGEVVGVNTALSSPNGASIGIGFAIPAKTARFVANSLIEKGKVERGYMGVAIQDIDWNLAEAMDLKAIRGALVTKVLKGTPARKAGIKEGDVILEFDGEKIKNASHLKHVVALTPPGEKVNLTIWRDGKTKAIKFRLGTRPKEMAMEEGIIEEEGWLGFSVEEQDSQVVVTEVKRGSDAFDAGLRTGDVLEKIGTVKIRSLLDFEKAKEMYLNEKKPIVFVVKRKGARRYLAIRPSS